MGHNKMVDRAVGLPGGFLEGPLIEYNLEQVFFVMARAS